MSFLPSGEVVQRCLANTRLERFQCLFEVTQADCSNVLRVLNCHELFRGQFAERNHRGFLHHRVQVCAGVSLSYLVESCPVCVTHLEVYFFQFVADHGFTGDAVGQRHVDSAGKAS